jgi:hypothetical protein
LLKYRQKRQSIPGWCASLDRAAEALTLLVASADAKSHALDVRIFQAAESSLVAAVTSLHTDARLPTVGEGTRTGEGGCPKLAKVGLLAFLGLMALGEQAEEERQEGEAIREELRQANEHGGREVSYLIATMVSAHTRYKVTQCLQHSHL